MGGSNVFLTIGINAEFRILTSRDIVSPAVEYIIIPPLAITNHIIHVQCAWLGTANLYP